MQRILLSALVVGGVIGAAIYGTSSFFSDTETSTGNVFTAGSVTLAIQEIVHDYFGDDNNAPDFSLTNSGFSFALADLKPLDAGEVTYKLSNGANDAYVCAAVVETANADNAINDPEADAGDDTDGANNGELGDFLSFKFGAFSGTLSSISGQWQSLGVVAANAAQASSLEYCFGEYDGENCILDEAALYNQAQTDSLNADVKFYAVQTRNNPNFTCASLNEEQPVWVETNQASGSAFIVPVVGGPLGGTALQLTTINDVNSRVRYTYSPLNINLADFTSFSYDSNQVSAFDQINGNASFRLIVDLDGVTTKDITFEPYYNIFAHNSLNDASIVPGTWQKWAADPANGKFWASGVLFSGGGGAYATNFTINELLAAYPTAKIIGISVGMGTYNLDQVVLVDNVILNGTVYDF